MKVTFYRRQSSKAKNLFPCHNTKSKGAFVREFDSIRQLVRFLQSAQRTVVMSPGESEITKSQFQYMCRILHSERGEF